MRAGLGLRIIGSRPLRGRNAPQGVRGTQPASPRLDRTRRRSRSGSLARAFRCRAIGGTGDHLAGRGRAEEPDERLVLRQRRGDRSAHLAPLPFRYQMRSFLPAPALAASQDTRRARVSTGGHHLRRRGAHAPPLRDLQAGLNGEYPSNRQRKGTAPRASTTSRTPTSTTRRLW